MSEVDRRDLGLLTRLLSERSPLPPAGYVPGKTSIRNALADLVACSMVEAEQIVEMLEARRFIRFSGDPARLEGREGSWTFHTRQE